MVSGRLRTDDAKSHHRSFCPPRRSYAEPLASTSHDAKAHRQSATESYASIDSSQTPRP